MRGGSHKMTSDEEGKGGGVRIPPKNDDVIYEQPQMHISFLLCAEPFHYITRARKSSESGRIFISLISNSIVTTVSEGFL